MQSPKLVLWLPLDSAFFHRLDSSFHHVETMYRFVLRSGHTDLHSQHSHISGKQSSHQSRSNWNLENKPLSHPDGTGISRTDNVQGRGFIVNIYLDIKIGSYLTQWQTDRCGMSGDGCFVLGPACLCVCLRSCCCAVSGGHPKTS